MKVIIKSQEREKEPFEVAAIELTKKQRVARSIKAFFLVFAAAIGAVFLPIIHFVLVPGLFLFAFVFAYFRYQEIASIPLGMVECPTCSSQLKEKTIFQKKTNPSPKAYILCKKCNKSVEIQVLA